MKKLLLTIAATLLATSAFAYDGELFEYDGLYYAVLSEDDHTAEVRSNSLNPDVPEHVVIPSKATYNGNEYTITRIGWGAFSNCTNLTSVDIPSTVTSIDYFAFQGSGLTSVAIPESVTEIGYMAFHGVPMTSVDIPKSVTSIGGAAFTSYTIEEINVAEGNSHYKSVNGVLCDYQLQTVVQYPLAKTTFELPESVTAIGDYAFYGCIFTDLTLPSTIKTIGQYAFWYNDLRSITLPEGVTSIDDYAFLNCVYLENINIPSSVNFIGACAFGHLQ